MKCHIEVFVDDQWHGAAMVTLSDSVKNGFRGTTCVIEYDFDYAFGHVRQPVSLTWPVDVQRHQTEGTPAFLYDLVPQGNGRRLLLNELRLPDCQASDAPMLFAGAISPIGCLRIRESVDYFERQIDRSALPENGFAFDELLAQVPAFHKTMVAHGMLAAGATGVQGVAPKYLLTKAKDGRWYPDAALDDEHASHHYIVKLPRGRTSVDRKVLRNEAAYIEVARRIGLRVFETPELHGDMLFICRFDRRAEQGKVLRFHQESAASLAGLAGFGVQANQFTLLAAIREVVKDPLGETIEFIRRDVLNLAMRNTDNHARNTAVQVVDGVAQLTPLFDFAPMYLDPEGITRAARWYRPDSKVELKQWADILPHLSLPEAELDRVVDALVSMRGQLDTLPAVMRESGVDDDIVNFLLPAIEAQRLQLSALR